MAGLFMLYICRGDFYVHFKHVKVVEPQVKSSNVSVFKLCYDMTFVMLKKSKQLKAEKFIYYRILWSKYMYKLQSFNVRMFFITTHTYIFNGAYLIVVVHSYT